MDRVKCKYCGQYSRKDALDCRACGAPLEPKEDESWVVGVGTKTGIEYNAVVETTACLEMFIGGINFEKGD